MGAASLARKALVRGTVYAVGGVGVFTGLILLASRAKNVRKTKKSFKTFYSDTQLSNTQYLNLSNTYLISIYGHLVKLSSNNSRVITDIINNYPYN